MNAPSMLGGSMPTPPNEAKFATNDKAGSFPQAQGGSPMNPPNTGTGGDHRNGSFPLGESRGVVVPPNKNFSLGKS